MAAADGDATLLSARPLWPAWAGRISVDIVISAESVEWQGHELRHAALPLALHDGQLEIRTASAQFAGGELQVDVTRQATGDTALQFRATHVTLGDIAALQAFVSGVPIDLAVELRGKGDSLHALAAAASGRVQIRNTGPGIVRHGFEAMGDNLVYHFISAFEVFRRPGADAVLECMAMDLPFRNGVALADKSMELRTRRLYVRGGGRVDLANESVDLIFKPETRGALKLQSLKVVERVRVHGPLAAPEVTLDSARLVGRAARFGLDVANLSGGAVVKRLLRRKPVAGLCGGALLAPLKIP